MVHTFGVEWRTPLTHLREYLHVLTTLLHEGEVEFEGSHVTARGRLDEPLQTPVMASAPATALLPALRRAGGRGDLLELAGRLPARARAARAA